MKIGILGGTGHMGSGLALRLVLKHDVLIGSRSLDRAQDFVKKLEDVARGFYQEEVQGSFQGVLCCTAVKEADVVFVSLPARAVISTLTGIKECFNQKQIIVSNVVPMVKSGKLFHYSPLSDDEKGQCSGSSAAEVIQETVGSIPVVCGFQTVPAAYLNNVDSILNIDVLIASDNEGAIMQVSKLIRDIPNLRPLNVGPLDNAKFIEPLTPLLLNASILNKLNTPSLRVVPWNSPSLER